MATPVPKPPNAGNAVTAIAKTKAAYANVRNGPGTNYDDIGDVYDNAIVKYYPNSRTSSNWYWLERGTLSGWIAGDVVTFEATNPGGGNKVPTPYDNKSAVWHWKGDSVPENTVEELVANLKNNAPNLKQIWVKTSDGSTWQGRYDQSAMAINGVNNIDHWVSVLQRNGLEFHAWCVPLGLDLEAESDIIAAVCNRVGVKSMILDIEPYDGFWQGGREAIRPFMTRLRQKVTAGFHIGISVDPRPWHYASIYPQEWFPFVDSIHPQTYWSTFRRDVEEVITEVYETWGGYGRPIIPALQGDAPVSEQNTAYNLCTGRYGAPGLSWWRYGVISQWQVINKKVEIGNPGGGGDPGDDYVYADEKIITPSNSDFRSGSYTGKTEFSEYTGTWNWKVLWKKTEVMSSKVWAEWKTKLSQSGIYEIAVFIPTRHATTKKARYKIHGIRGTNTEVIVDIDQSRHRNVWVPLGIFDLVKEQTNAGKVFLNDVTGEFDKEIAFDAVRFRRIVKVPGNGGTNPPKPTNPDIIDGVYVSNGFDSPVGTKEQRDGSRVWPEGWLDASPFAKMYFVGTPNAAYHTGADLNWGKPYADKGLPVSSPASGVVVFAGALKVWGNVIVIKHDPLYTPTGKIIYSRHGHVQNMHVKVGDRVKRGDLIAEIGDAFGRYTPHLHFDLSATTILATKPGDWPGLNLSYLLKHYIDPKDFILSNRPK